MRQERTHAVEDTGRRALIAGVELGGTKCICVRATADGDIVDQSIIPTTNPAETIGAIAATLRGWWDEEPFVSLGIASFGPLDLDPLSPAYGHITTTAKPGWRDAAVLGPIAADFGVPVAFDTDVNGAALAELRWGAAAGLDDFAYVTVGTGVGVGLIVNGKPTRGLSHCEIGHLHVPRLAHNDWPGVCPYHGGCVEGLASGGAIRARLGDAHVGAIGANHPVWDGVVEALAQMAHAMVLMTGPKRILIGGGVAAGQPHLLPRIETRLRDLIAGYVALPSPDADETYVRAPGLGTEAGPRGPIALALGALGINASR
ncbi:ROK family protein [Sphingomonas sp. SUN019]|uniref:ROK family protein n=1 Tax=Sphingomonas sp. SUN019 TaxID=2937788 RepID=UPI002164A211|nr:ROK family protein [Sphingomonas sp. SUN019]